ncbi:MULTISPECIES: CBS domain-containing protein [Acinetobacter]|jgi:CBS domain-containing protein|uniref:CBS domain-containing protein n=1 Tax=Acinetobacter chengduensis TaxID=2420890 RepID=A0ABX9TY72_9GAMM|nr:MULTISPECIES: CBS domain-containing protein [Acinetobacter]MBI1452377.1 CBS domain-containing protein [Acinetobacter sp. FL51]RKG44629.1 CBS domain-containing protein [Acinetobacter sp. WCHAc060007]RLL23393.1 CBS domain-containing protein [Acinetobacter chengduensis]
MTNVAQVLKEKAFQTVYTIRPDATVLDAISLMAEKGIGAIVVTETNGQLAGILSERDYTRKIALMQRKSFDTTVSEIMTAKVLTVTQSATVEDCLELMTDKHLRHLPVVENDQLLGLISIGDLVKAAMDDQHKLIEQLQQYISG